MNPFITFQEIVGTKIVSWTSRSFSLSPLFCSSLPFLYDIEPRILSYRSYSTNWEFVPSMFYLITCPNGTPHSSFFSTFCSATYWLLYTRQFLPSQHTAATYRRRSVASYFPRHMDFLLPTQKLDTFYDDSLRQMKMAFRDVIKVQWMQVQSWGGSFTCKRHKNMNCSSQLKGME